MKRFYMPEIEIIVQKGDFERDVYTFWFNADNVLLVLRAYSIQERETKRKQYRKIRWWNQFNQRDATIKLSEITIPQEVIQAAKQKLIDTIAQNVQVVLER